MKPSHHFSDRDRDLLRSRLGAIDADPYHDYGRFAEGVADAARSAEVLETMGAVCESIHADRSAGIAHVHVLRNCPVDAEIPLLDLEDPLKDKYLRKTTHVSEAFLAVFATLTRTPLLAYSSRHRGDFFTDVIAVKRYEGKATGFSAGDLVYHNDRTSHTVRADYISLLGMRCPPDDLVYTIFVDGKDLLRHIPAASQEVLRQPYFITPFDVYSRDQNARQVTSDPHAILEGVHCFRYRDTATTTAPDAPVAAKDALIALKDALAVAPKARHRIISGDLLALANQSGLHTRERVEVSDPEMARNRWLQKTYSFRDDAARAVHDTRWRDGVAGLVAD